MVIVLCEERIIEKRYVVLSEDMKKKCNIFVDAVGEGGNNLSELKVKHSDDNVFFFSLYFRSKSLMAGIFQIKKQKGKKCTPY